MTNLFISLYPFYFIILAAKTATQITNKKLENEAMYTNYTCTTKTGAT